MKHTLTLLTALLLLGGARAMADSVPIRNDTVWKDNRGQEIMGQGGNLAKFGDPFYFYGWGDSPGDNRWSQRTKLGIGKIGKDIR